MRGLAGACLLLIPLLLLLPVLGSVVLSVPLLTDKQLAIYIDVAADLEVPIPWDALVAVDAIRFQQDFSRVDRATVEETARLFVICAGPVPVTYSDRLLKPGVVAAQAFVVEHPSHVSWSVTTTEGRVLVEVVDQEYQRYGHGDRLEPGGYQIAVEATAAPAAFTVELQLRMDPPCASRELERVMDELRLRADDRELVRNLLLAFVAAPANGFQPNPGSRFTWPVQGPITSYFGYRNHPVYGGWSFHSGVDIAAEYGTPVQAAAAGRVVYAGVDGGYGNTVRLHHGGFTTTYAHLFSYNVTVGEEVQQGEVIGLVGSTGLSTGPHLHFEWWMGRTPVDPLQVYR